MLAFISTGSSKGSDAAGTPRTIQAVHEARKVIAHAGESLRAVVCYRLTPVRPRGPYRRESQAAAAALAESLAAFVA
jgi:nucleotide-binding universal stress UspA family protein